MTGNDLCHLFRIGDICLEGRQAFGGFKVGGAGHGGHAASARQRLLADVAADVSGSAEDDDGHDQSFLMLEGRYGLQRPIGTDVALHG